VAANIAMGRNIAGIHRRTDYSESLTLGEEITLGILEEPQSTYREGGSFTFTTFHGQRSRSEAAGKKRNLAQPTSEDAGSHLRQGPGTGHVCAMDTLHADRVLVPMLEACSFRSFQAAAAEATVSCLFGGIHFPFYNHERLSTGQCVGQAIDQRMRFRNEDDE